MEEWKVIQLFDGKYEASSYGHIRKIGTSSYMYEEENRLGYKSVKIKFNGNRKHYKVHRLVAMAFLPNPNNFSEVNHKDENPSNNNVSNLEWCTHIYNMNYGTLKARMRLSRLGQPSNNGLSKCVEQYDLFGNYLNTYKSIQEAANQTGVDRGNIRRICEGKTKKPRKYIFKYKER